MPAWAQTAWAVGAWAGTAWAEAGVSVPDVVGETQAAGTATLEGAGFVVAVNTAHSSTVPTGIIISQNPIGGSEVPAGSTVNITVSLGEAPQPDHGPGGFEGDYERELQRRRKRRLEMQARQEEAQRIDDSTTREIAQLLREQEAKDERRAEIDRLARLVRAHSRKTLAYVPQRVLTAYARAVEQLNFSALEALERELARMMEEEEIAVSIILFQ